MGLLLSVNIAMQFQLVLAAERKAPSAAFIVIRPDPSVGQNSLLQLSAPKNFFPFSRWFATPTKSQIAQPPLAATTTISTTTVAMTSPQDCHSFDESNNWSRRNFLTAAAGVCTPLAFLDMANADDGNATDVDWDAFGAPLRQTAPLSSPFTTPVSMPGASGSDLQKALQDSAKRKQIDPRTHG